MPPSPSQPFSASSNSIRVDILCQCIDVLHVALRIVIRLLLITSVPYPMTPPRRSMGIVIREPAVDSSSAPTFPRVKKEDEPRRSKKEK
jgi:hypothetical protein